MNPRCLAIGLVTFLAVTSPAIAGPVTIQYLVSDLSDNVVGEDPWQISYFVSGSFQVDRGFSIYFESDLILQSSPPAPNADWDILTYQVDPPLDSSGVYDALALTSNASLIDPFVVNFVLGLGATPPGSQFFEVYEVLYDQDPILGPSASSQMDTRPPFQSRRRY